MRHLGCYLYSEYSFAPCFVYTIDFCFPFVDKMAPKSAMVEFRLCLLKRPHEANGSDNSGLASSEELKISPTLGSSALEGKITGKKEAKAEGAIQLDFEVPLTSKAKSKLHMLAKNFAYPQFMDKELMAPACLEQLQGNEDDLVEKFQWASRMLLELAAIL